MVGSIPEPGGPLDMGLRGQAPELDERTAKYVYHTHRYLHKSIVEPLRDQVRLFSQSHRLFRSFFTCTLSLSRVRFLE